MTKITGKNNQATDLQTIKEFLKWAARIMTEADLSTPMLEARYLAGRILQLSPAELLTKSDQILQPEQIIQLTAAVRRRAQYEPAAYIVGRHGFYGRDFVVGPGVLIPRPDTEILIERVLATAVNLPEKVKLLDCFTGSGCIGITLASELASAGREVELTLTDISSEALTYASENINKYGLQHNCRLEKADIWPDEQTQWHIITANPPYIDSESINTLQPEVNCFEPIQALDGGADGLVFYRRLFAEADQYLCSGGLLACEHGYDQQAPIRQLAIEMKWQQIKQYNDYGGNARVTICNKL